MNALGVHLLGVVVWTGGLLALVVMRRPLGSDLGPTVARYSTVAAWCFGAVALTGLQQAWIRLGSVDGLFTAYGAVVALKTVAIMTLGVLGWLHRRNIAEVLAVRPGDGRAFARLAVVELAVMGAATGLAAVLARSVPPVPDAAPDPSRILELTGYPDPGPMDRRRLVHHLAHRLAVPRHRRSVAVGLYARRGRARCGGAATRWPVAAHRVLGARLGAVRVGHLQRTRHLGAGAVQRAHGHAHGSGDDGAVAARPRRARSRSRCGRSSPGRDKTWGPREVLLQVVHSRAMRVLANPVVAASLFFFSLAAFYWTGLFQLSLTTHTGHLLMMAHFMLTGYLFVWVLIGIDPGPPRWSPLMLLVILFATISFHAFFGVALTGSETLLAPDFFGQINLPWGPDPLADQHLAGEIAWGFGEAPDADPGRRGGRPVVQARRAGDTAQGPPGRP